MIRPIDIRLNAAHPDYPLAEAVTYTGAPSTVFIRGVPGNCGRWAITAVSVAATFPDGSTTTRAAVQSANGVWVATLPATATSGRTAQGVRILADGVDENGAAVTGYILGVADFAVASLAVTPAPQPGETSWQMLYFDAVPGVLRKGDVAKVDGVLKLHNGTAWEAFAGDIPAPSAATPAMDGAGAAGSSAEYARGDHVHPSDTSRVPTSRKVNGKALSADVTLVAGDIPMSNSPSETENVASKISQIVQSISHLPGFGDLTGMVSSIGYAITQNPYSNGSTYQVGDYCTLVSSTQGNIGIKLYRCTTAITTPEDFTPAHWQEVWVFPEILSLLASKQSALSAQQLANIAAVPNKANDADVVHKTGAETIAGIKTFADSITMQSGLDVPWIYLYQLRIMTNAGEVYVPNAASGTLALTAGTGHEGNLAALDANGNPTDAGYRFEVRDGIPYIIETTND